MATFSGAVKLTNLDDYIAPSQECIKPIKFDKTADKFSPTSLSIQEDGSYVEIDQQGKATKLEKAKITLNDCLACSGCVTSAETVLIAEQTYKELLKTLSSTDDHHKMVVVSVSPQSCASLSVKYGLPFDQMSSKLVSFFKSLGVHYVFDITFSRDISLMESACEFVERFNNTTKPGSLPMLASACPGWICYAEKTHGDHILPHISTTKSPQQIMGSLVKDYLANMEGKTPDQIYHVTIMPCYDKKLEASREDFYQDMYRTRDVDCVITSGEVETMLTERGVDISSLPLTPMDHPFCSYEGNELVGHNGGGSGGYMEYIFKYASQKLFHQKIDRVNYTILRNKDFQECSLEIDGQVVLRFASAYGFRNIQNIVQKLKRKKCTYHYIEVMACPSGCLNGGGQIKDSDGNAQSISKATLESVEASYNSSKHRSPDDNPYMASLYQDWLDKGTEPDKVKLLLHTQYHAVPKMSHSLNIKCFAGGDDCPVIQSTLLDNLSIRERKALSPKDKILALAGQKDIISVEDFFTPVMIRTLTKLGEGVFGEVFNCYTSEGDGIAVKIMPIEGTEIVNDEKQKTFSEILPEMIISKELSDLGKDETSDHYTKNFVQLYKLGISKGEYPTFLVNAWDDWDEREESDNERPDKFQDNQLYAMFAFENSGSALEAFTFHSVREAKSVLTQIAGTLAVGESALKFEHRDMHRGNILVRRTKEKDMIFIIDSRKYVLPSEGVHVTVIDYTLSRLSQGNCISYNDLNNLPWLFKGKENDIQHQTYLHMQNCTNNDWSRFAPKTNAYWLYYIATKMSIKSHVKNINRSQIQSAFRPFLNKFLKYGSAKEIFLNLFSRPSPLRGGRKL